MKLLTQLLALASLFPLALMAQEAEVQDMSDPTAVYTQAGAGLTNRGINFKLGDSYDTGNPDTMAMNVVEVKGFWGDTFGWDDPRNQSVDSVRFRNFKLNLTNGRGTQVDANYNRKGNQLAEANLDISYSVIQALPPVGRFNFYPLAGFGMAMGKNAEEDDGSIDSGYSIMGFNGLVGTYIKFAITDKMWINYNPFYFAAISGSDNYENNAYGNGNDSVLTHEFAYSYQFTPVFNVRYFANWSEYVDFQDGDHRIEFNYQL
jgi:hypothetical protein